MELVVVDFASVWARTSSLLNYVPGTGFKIGVIFPPRLTLVQFESLTPFQVASAGLGGVQFIVDNVVESAVRGKSLNLISLVIILSLTFWSLLGGIPGKFLAVSILVMAVIICSRLDELRGIAVILSAGGTLVASGDRPKRDRD